MSRASWRPPPLAPARAIAAHGPGDDHRAEHDERDDEERRRRPRTPRRAHPDPTAGRGHTASAPQPADRVRGASPLERPHTSSPRGDPLRSASPRATTSSARCGGPRAAASGGRPRARGRPARLARRRRLRAPRRRRAGAVRVSTRDVVGAARGERPIAMLRGALVAQLLRLHVAGCRDRGPLRRGDAVALAASGRDDDLVARCSTGSTPTNAPDSPPRSAPTRRSSSSASPRVPSRWSPRVGVRQQVPRRRRRRRAAWTRRPRARRRPGGSTACVCLLDVTTSRARGAPRARPHLPRAARDAARAASHRCASRRSRPPTAASLVRDVDAGAARRRPSRSCSTSSRRRRCA